MDLDLGDFDFDANDIIPETKMTLKEIFSGDVNDNNYDLNKIKQDLWGNDNIDFTKANGNDINFQFPQTNINISK